MLIQEWKKLFEKKRIFMLAVLGVFFYFLFFQTNVGIPSYSSENINLQISKELKEKYGANMDAVEYEEFVSSIEPAKENPVDIWIKENESFSDAGIQSYGELLQKQDQLSREMAMSLTSQVLNHFTENQLRDAFQDNWEQEYKKTFIETYKIETKARKSEEVYSLMPEIVMKKYLTLLPDFTIFVILSGILLVVPYAVKDKMEGVTVLQYSSRKGCKYYWKKLEAAFIGLVALNLCEIGFLLGMVWKNGGFTFLDCYVSGFMTSFLASWKVTFGQYIAISILFIMVCSILLSLLAYCLASLAGNYVSAIAFQIPLIIFGMIISMGVMPHFLEITQKSLWLYFIPVICVVMAVTGNFIRSWTIRRYEKC